MPSRWLSMGIVACWLATTGWLIWHDLWPNWRPGQPPRFSIDLVEEVRNNTRVRIHWNVLRQKKEETTPTRIFYAETWTDYQPDEDTFALHAELKARVDGALELPLLSFLFQVDLLSSEYRVDRAGHLKGLRTEAHLALQENKPKEKKNDLRKSKDSAKIPFNLKVWGDVREGQFVAHCRADLPRVMDGTEMTLPAVPVPRDVSILLPLHPVNRIHGLYPGQSWRQPLIDPIRDALGSILGPGGVRFINARVLLEPQVLQEGGEAALTCLVIEYEDEGEIVGHTWVERESERVQQQEIVLDGDTWIMKRDNPRRANKPGARPARFTHD